MNFLHRETLKSQVLYSRMATPRRSRPLPPFPEMCVHPTVALSEGGAALIHALSQTYFMR